MGKRSSGFIYFWIFVYQQNIWNEKYIFEWYIFFLTYFIDGKLFVWISLILDDTFFFFNLFFRGENSSISSTWVVTKSYLRGIGPLLMLDRKWPEVTWPEVTWLFPLLSFLFGFIDRTFSWNQFYFLYLATS